MGTLQERNPSYWVRTSEPGAFAPLEEDSAADVVVIGAGIAGLTTAHLCAERGARVVVIDAGDVCAGATGYTTAKVTALHGLRYSDLAARHDDATARLYAEANQAAVDKVEELAASLAPDCGYTRAPAFTYVTAGAVDEVKAVDDIKAEVDAARAAGLPALLVTATDLPFPVAAAVRLDDQGHFHPRRYGLGLARAVEAAGGEIHAHTRARRVDDNDDGVEVVTDDALIRARYAVVATHLPFGEMGAFFARARPSRSYAMAVRVEGDRPEGMYLAADGPTRSVRPAADDDVLIIGGGGHVPGEDHDTEGNYRDLEEWARRKFRVTEVLARWSAQDYTSVDGIPYIGRVPGRSDRVLVATAFGKWGMTNGTVAGMILSELAAGAGHPWLAAFDATRVNAAASAKDFVKQNVAAGKHLVVDRIRSLRAPSVDELPLGAGTIVDTPEGKVAAFRDENGDVHAVDATCTHLGCQVAFNNAERTWDCPCHGSRFALDGTVLEGPAVDDLEPVEAVPS